MAAVDKPATVFTVLQQALASAMHLQVAAFVALISGAAVSAERVRYGARTIAPGETTDGSVRWVSNKDSNIAITMLPHAVQLLDVP